MKKFILFTTVAILTLPNLAFSEDCKGTVESEFKLCVGDVVTHTTKTGETKTTITPKNMCDTAMMRAMWQNGMKCKNKESDPTHGACLTFDINETEVKSTTCCSNKALAYCAHEPRKTGDHLFEESDVFLEME